MFQVGYMMFSIYVASLLFWDSLKHRETLLLARGKSLRKVFWEGFSSGLYTGLSVVIKEMWVYSYGPALLFLQLFLIPCGFLSAQYAVKSLFGAFVPGEKNVRVWFFRISISLLGVISGILLALVGGKLLGI